MKLALPTLLLGLVALPAPAQSHAPREEWPGRTLKILYAGSPGGFREGSFKTFLQEWFDKAETIDLRELTVAAAEPYDVVIADWTSRYGKDGYAEDMSGAGVLLPKDFAKPVIMVSAVGGELVRGRSKIGWL
jgi:hypothetical protein